jgi:serine/threonine protein kinase
MAELNGRYRILGVAGTGGMGTVYRAADTQLGDRLVAVKELSATGLSPADLAEITDAFHQEALLLAGLQHPGLPSIHDHFTEGGQWYLVMDFIEGQTLEQMLQHTGTPGLPVTEVLRIADELCAVLDYLHRQQPPIIFRDLKPSNVMVTPTGQLVLIDFGIARLFKPGQAHDTVPFGSPGYAAPEQFGKAQTTVRSDIFSLGVVLHQLLTGIDPSVKPFSFPPVWSCNPQTPQAFEALILQMVQLDEGKRPPSIAWVRHDLQQIARQASTRRPSTPTPQPPPSVPNTHASLAPPKPMPSTHPRPPVNRRPMWSRTWVQVLVCIGVAALVTRGVSAMCSSMGAAFSGALSGALQDGAVNNAQSALSSDLTTLSADVATLAQDPTFTSDLAAYARDWKTMQQDYHTEQQDHRQGCGAYGDNAVQVRDDAIQVHDDLIEIHNDDLGLGNDVRPVQTDLSQVQTDIQTVQTDLTELQSAVAADTAGTPSIQVSADGVNSAVSQAQQQVDASNQALQAAQAKATQYDQEVAQMDNAAGHLADSMQC